ncbi:MAG: NAD(P)-binding protein [Synergistaceae bacterium]|nr:NAD(P)-binding protein [Synergistaceae bacterium]
MKYIIIGGGPSGLTFANRLLQFGEKVFLLVEACDEVGGLCKSENVDGSPLDTGGGHFLDVRNKRVLDFLFGFMPEREWNLFERDSRIYLHDRYVHHPIEANICQSPRPAVTLERQALRSSLSGVAGSWVIA